MSTTGPEEGSRRWRVHVAWLLVLLVAVAGTCWAAWMVLRPAGAADVAAPQVPTYTVTAGEIGVTTGAIGELAYSPGPPGLAGAGGTLTSVDLDASRSIEAGDVLLSIDLRPMVAARGPVPAFREMRRGTAGPDVAQLREFLGLPEGQEFDGQTEAAVFRWQGELGLVPDGVVRPGDVLFLPSLPTRGFVRDELVVGARVGEGELVVETVHDVPIIVALPDSNAGVQAGMEARVAIGDQVLGGVLGEGMVRGDGLLGFEVLDAQGQPVCGGECVGHTSIGAPTQVNVEIDLLPNREGLVVPDASLVIRPDGTTAVRARGGELIAVDVVVQSDGMSIIEGVAEGTVIDLFGDDPS